VASYSYRQKTRTPYGQGAYGRPAARASSKDPLIGTRVRHSKYGVGTIIGVEGEGEERKLTVSFQDYGAKKLIERYANLQLA
jgi:DNA helicase-2/ATP-dependent DNA helicase PcrA